MSPHVPDGSPDCHWYPNPIGGVPLHEPGEAVSVWLSCAVPETTGSEVLAGGVGGATVAVGGESTVTDPAALVAVTRTSSALPTSPVASVYVDEAAPVMSAHVPDGSHDCHWWAKPIGGGPLQGPGDADTVGPDSA